MRIYPNHATAWERAWLDLATEGTSHIGQFFDSVSLARLMIDEEIAGDIDMRYQRLRYARPDSTTRRRFFADFFRRAAKLDYFSGISLKAG